MAESKRQESASGKDGRSNSRRRIQDTRLFHLFFASPMAGFATQRVGRERKRETVYSNCMSVCEASGGHN